MGRDNHLVELELASDKLLVAAKKALKIMEGGHWDDEERISCRECDEREIETFYMDGQKFFRLAHRSDCIISLLRSAIAEIEAL